MIYLDNAATSHPKAPGVPEAVAACLAGGAGSPGRASHPPAREASRIVFEAREACAELLGLEAPERLIFTRNATEALNLAILGTVGPGGTVAVTSLEHNAVMRPVRHLEAMGARVLVAPFDGRGRPDAEALDRVLGERPDLFVMTTASNVSGALLPVEEVAERCARAGIPLCADASQSAGHLPLPKGCACVALPGHKGLLGPGGTGVLHLAPGFDPPPLLRGGTGSDSDSEFQPEAMPDRYEAGTPNVPGLAGLLTAVRYLATAGPGGEASFARDLALGLAALPGVALLGPGPRDPRAPVVSITVADRDLGEVARDLDARGICVRAGLHCAPAAHRTLGTLAAGGAVRFSPGRFTTAKDLEGALAAMEEILCG